MTKRIIYIIRCMLVLLLMLPTFAYASKSKKDTTELRIVDISRAGSDVQLVYDLPLDKPKMDYKVTIQPAICGEKDTILMDPIVINGWNNIRELHRDHVLNHKDEPEQEYYPQKLRVRVLRDTVLYPMATYNWLLTDSVTICRLKQVKEGCCKVIEENDSCSNPYSYEDKLLSMLDTITYMTVDPVTSRTIQETPVLIPIEKYQPYVSTDVLSNREDVLCIHYALNSYKVDRDYRGNGGMLDTLVQVIKTIRQDPMADVRIIQIIGLASIEGPEENNRRLALARARALKKYLAAEAEAPDSIFEVVNGGEAWSEFAWQLQNSEFEGKDDLMQIVNDTNMLPNKKESKIKKLNNGKTYKYVRDNLFADQRNAGYMRIYYGLNEDEVAKAINEAIALINDRKYSEALPLLMPYQDEPRAWNAIGVCYYMTGEEEEANRYWDKAKEYNPDGKAPERHISIEQASH